MTMINSKDYIYINGVSSDTVGLYIDTPPVPPTALRRGTSYNLGGEADVFSLENGYDDITVKIKAFVFFAEDFDNSELNSYLQNVKTLQTSRNTKFYYKVKRVTSVSASVSADGKKIKYEISFLCYPFKYFVDNPEIPLTHGIIIENNGKLFSRPVFKFTVSKMFKLAVNGTELTVFNKQNDADVVVDCERMIAYSGNEMLKTSGYFPMLAVGQNKVTWGAQSLTAASVIVNARCY